MDREEELEEEGVKGLYVLEQGIGGESLDGLFSMTQPVEEEEVGAVACEAGLYGKRGAGKVSRERALSTRSDWGEMLTSSTVSESAEGSAIVLITTSRMRRRDF